jgi:predicted phage terminase large subunit-like protein
LANSRSTLGSFNYSAQYQQCPVPAEGEIIKWQSFQTYHPLPNQRSGDRIVQSWDTALKAGEFNDYSVCTTWLVRGNDYYLLHVLREKLLFPALRQAVIDQAQAYDAHDIIIEDKGSGTSLIQTLSYEAGIPRPTAFKPDVDKTTRMSAQSSRIEARQVRLPPRASWLDDFRTEMLTFPNGKHDDQVDSLSQFLDWIERPSGNRVWTQTWGV